MTNFQRARGLLAQRLRELRQDARLTGRGLAEATGWPPSKVSKIEGGRQTPTDDDVHAWAEACGVPEAAGDLVVALRNLEGHYIEHQRLFRAGKAGPQRELAQQEAARSTIRVFEPALVPGLLQTPEYARCAFSLGSRHLSGPDDLDQAVAARMTRQQVLYQPRTQVHMVATEAVLRYGFCPPEIMAGQLDRLISAVGTHVIRLGIIPFGAKGIRLPLHGFWIYDEEEVAVETMTASLTLSEPSEIRAYLGLFAHYGKAAVYGAEARALIERAAARLDQV